MTFGRMDGKGRVMIPRRVREEIGLSPGDPYFSVVVKGELRIVPARDPFAHLSGEELMQADAAWAREHPEEVRSVRNEMEAWDSANLDNLEPEYWDDAPRAPRTR